NAVYGDGLTRQNRIEPADATGAAGDGTEFMTARGDALADFIKQFGRERAGTDAGGVGFENPQHIADRLRPHAGAGSGLTGDRIGRGDERIGAVVDIEQRALRAFEQDALAFVPGLVEHIPDRLSE